MQSSPVGASDARIQKVRKASRLRLVGIPDQWERANGQGKLAVHFPMPKHTNPPTVCARASQAPSPDPSLKLNTGLTTAAIATRIGTGTYTPLARQPAQLNVSVLAPPLPRLRSLCSHDAHTGMLMPIRSHRRPQQSETLVETPTSGPGTRARERSTSLGPYWHCEVVSVRAGHNARTAAFCPTTGQALLRVLLLRGTIRYPRHACPGEEGTTPVTSPRDGSVY